MSVMVVSSHHIMVSRTGKCTQTQIRFLYLTGQDAE
uniref:Uncharacterized protein n=1 Tax=Anguilla anguilla TaxID=7936 RepID=A0A0E9WW18_ANGAN